MVTDEGSNAFKEVAIIRHPHHGEYAIGFITSTVILRGTMGAEELRCVYVPTNHLYLGDIFLISSKDILRTNLSVREGIGKSPSPFIKRQCSGSFLEYNANLAFFLF